MESDVGNFFRKARGPKKQEDCRYLAGDSGVCRKVFGVLHNWTHTDDCSQGNLKLTFIVDEDAYFVFIYSDPLSKSFREFSHKVGEDNKYEKYGKEHAPLVMQQILCHGFPTTKDFALGMFLDNNPPGKEFLLAPYITGKDGTPIAADKIQPILMSDYKSKIPDELGDDDFESVHWKKIIAKDRKAVGSDA